MKPKYSLVNVRASRRFFVPAILATALALALSVKTSQGQALFWDNTGGTANAWNSIPNWSTVVAGGTDPAATPGSGNVATFSATPIVGTAQTVNLNADQSIQGLDFTSSVTAATTFQAGGTNRILTLGTSGITKAGTGAVTIGSATAGQQVAIALNAAQTWTNSNNTGAITITNGVSSNASGARALTLGGTSTAANTVSGIIANGSGTVSVTKSGAGNWTLSGANTYSGGTTISGGTLVISNATSLGSGAVTVSGSSTINASALTFANSLAVNAALSIRNTGAANTTSTFSGVLSGSSAITVVNSNLGGSNQATIAATNTANTFTGNVILPSATGGSDYFSFASIGDGGNFTFARPSWREGVIYTGSANVTFATRQIALASTIGTAAGLDGNNIPVNMFQNNGTGTVTFSQPMSVPTSISTSTFFFFGGSNTGNNTFSGVIAAPGGANTLGIGKWDAGRWVLTGANSYTGATWIANGTLAINGIDNSGVAQPSGTNSLIRLGFAGTSGALDYVGTTDASTNKQVQLGDGTAGNAGAGSILSNGTGSITFSNAAFNTAITGITAARTLTLGGTNTGANTIAGVIANNATGGTVALNKVGAGTWTLSGANTYSGGTTIGTQNGNVGTLNITNSAALGTGAVTIVSNATNGLAALTLNSATGITVPNNFTTSGEGQGGNGIIRNVTGNNTITGTLTLAGGGGSTRIHSDGGSLTLSNTIAPSTTARFLFLGGSATGTVSGSINNGSGSNVLSGLTKSGTGTWTLSANNGFSGPVAVNGGTLSITGVNNSFNGNIVVDGTNSMLQVTGSNGSATGGMLGFIAGGTTTAGYKTVTLQNGGIFRNTANFNNNVPTTALPANGYVFTIGTGGGVFDVSSGTTLIIDDGTGTGTGTAASQLQGTGDLTKTGLGTFQFDDSTAYPGTITVTAGLLQPASGNAFGANTAGTFIQSGAALNVNGVTMTNAEPLTIAGTGLASAPAGVLTNASGAAATWAGPVTMSAASTIGSSGAGGLTLSAGATVDNAGNLLTIAVSGGGRIFTDGSISGSGGMVVNNTGAGDYVPRADHTYSGGTVVTAGLIAVDRNSIGEPGAPTSGAFGTGVLEIAGGQMRSGTGGDRTVGNAVTISADPTFFTVAAEKSLIFSGPVTMTGASRVFNVAVGSTVATSAVRFMGAMGDGSNGYALTKTGTGNMVLGGANTYTGGTTVNAGSLILAGSVPTNTPLAINATGAGGVSFSLASTTANALTDVSALTLGSVTGPTNLGLELGADTSASDRIVTPNAALASGTVNLNIMPLAGFGSASSYNLISASSGLSGANYVLNSAPGGFVYSLNVSDTAVQLGVTPSTAGDLYWRGNTNNSWSAVNGVNTNWFTDSAGATNAQANPGAGDTVIFSTANAVNNFGAITTTLDNLFTVKKIIFGNNPNGVSSVTVAPGITPAAALGVLTVAPSVSSDGIAVGANAGNVVISAPVILGTDQTWSVNGTGLNGSSLTVSGAISGTNSLNISGLVTLSAPATSNTYSGTTFVPSGGILQGGATNSFSTASLVNVTGTGVVRLNGVNNSVPALTGDGIVQNNHASTAATLTVGDATDFSFSGTMQNGSGGTLGLTKAGAGVFTLTGTHTYTGATTVSAGTLRQGVANVLPAATGLTVNGTGVFDLNGLNASVTTLAGDGSGTVTDNASGSGTSVLSIAAAGSSATKLSDGASRAVGLRITNSNGGFLLTSAGNTFSGGIVLTNSIAGTRMSPGTILAGAYGTGPITVGEAPTDRAGIFFATANQVLSNPIIINTAAGTDRVGIRSDVAGIVLSGQITANLAPVTFSSNGTGAFSLTGKITGNQGLALDSSTSGTAITVTLNNPSADNDYAGDTIIGQNATTGRNRTLQVGVAEQIPHGAGKGNVIVTSNGTGIGLLSLAAVNETINGLSGNGNVASTSGTVTLTLGDNNATASHSGAINNTAGTLSVTKIGTGTQTLSGTSNFAGALTVNGGLVAVPSSPATAGPLGNSTVVNLNGGGISHTASGSNNLNRPIVIGTSNGTVDVASSTGVLTAAVTSNGGNLVKTGPGTLLLPLPTDTTLNGGAAGVVVTEGTLRTGFGTSGVARIAVGSAGHLDMRNGAAQALALSNTAGALNLANGAQLGFELDGAANDSIATDTAVTAGVVTLNLFNTGAGVAAGTYNLISAVNGGLDAANYVIGSAPSGFNYTINKSDTLVSVVVTSQSAIFWRGGVDLSWNTLGSGPANWTTDGAGTTDALSKPVAADVVTFSATGAPMSGNEIATTLDAAFAVNGLLFTSSPVGVSAVSIAAGTGGSLTLTPSSSVNGINVLANGGNVTISAPVTTGAPQTWNVDPTGSLTISGNITFTGAVNKTSAGVLTLSGTNSGAGGITLSGGTLRLENEAALGSGVLNVGAGTSIESSVFGLALSTNNTQNWNGDFTFSGNNDLNLGTGAVTLTNNIAVTTSISALTVGGAIGDGGNNRSLTKAGAGTLVLTNANTYGGLTMINGGVLRITNSGALGSTAAGTVQSGSSALELDGTAGAITIGAEPLTINGTGFASTGALRNIDGNNTFGGTVSLAAASRINSDSGILTLNNATAVSSSGQNLTVGGNGSVVISGNVALGLGGVTRDGSGTLTLSGANTYTGDTTVQSGTLNITGSLSGNGGVSTGAVLTYGAAAGNSVVNVSGNINNYLRFQGATNASASAAYIQTGGNVNFTSTGTANPTQVVASAGYGYMEITGGTLRANGRFAPSNGAATTGVMYIGGTGTLDTSGGEWLLMSYVGSGNAGRSMLTVDTGGTLDRVGASNLFGLNMDRNNGYAVLNIVGGSVLNSNRAITFGNGANAGSDTTGFLNLAAGTLQIGANMANGNTGAGSTGNNAYLNFAGGTLRAQAALTNAIPVSAANQTFTSTIYGAIDNVGTSHDFVGGLTVDTNGFDTTLANNLLSASADGVAQSSLTINGGSGYIGAPMVQFTGGTLAPGGAPAAGYAVVSGGVVTEIVITAPGSYTTAPTVTLTGGGGSGATVSVETLVPNTPGGITKNGSGILTLSGANTFTGSTQVNGGTLLLNGAAATGVLSTSEVTVNAGGALAFTSGAASALNLSGKSMTLSGGAVNFDVGASGVNDTINVDNFTLTANSAFTFNSIGGLTQGATYTLLTTTNPIVNTGSFTISGQTIGQVTLTPTINANSITVTATLNESQWAVNASGNWGTGTNWSGYLPSIAGDAAVFGSAINSPQTVTVDTPQTVGFMRFDNANSYTIGSNGSSLLTLSNGTNPANVSVTLGSHTIAENVALLSNLTVLHNTGTALTMSGAISGTGRAVTVNGPGTVVLSGVNTYTGATTVSNGILTLSGARTVTATGGFNVGNVAGNTATLNVSAGTFTVGAAGSNFLIGSITGATGVMNQTGGSLTTTGNQLLVGNDASTGIYNLSGGTLTTVAGSLGVTVGVNAGATATFNLSDTGVLSMPATSTLQICRSDNSASVTGVTGTFNQTGGTATVGILQVGGQANNSNATANLNLTGGTFSAVTFNVFSAAPNSNTAVTIGGSAQVTLPAFPTRGATSTTSLILDSTTGFLRPTATSASYMPAGTFNAGAKLSANGAKIDTNGFDITIGQVFEDQTTLGTLTKSGTGNLTLTGVNTYTGATTINGGTLTINEGSIASSSNIVNNGALAYALTTNARTYANAITGTGSLTKSGTNSLTLSGTNTYAGNTSVTAGTLQIDGSTNVGSGNLSVGVGAVSTLIIGPAGSFTTTGAFSLGSGIAGHTVTIQSGGSLSAASLNNPWGASYTVNGTMSINGNWTVSTNRTGDTFAGSGNISAGALTLGNFTTGITYTGTGTVTIAGALTVASSGAGAPVYAQNSGTLNAGSVLLGDGFAGTRTFSLNGGRVNVGAGGIAATGAGASTRNVNLGPGTLGARADWSSSLAMALTSASPGLTVDTLDSVNNTTGRTITLSGVLSGAGALTKAGAGTLVLSAANTYAGATTVNGGSLVVNGSITSTTSAASTGTLAGSGTINGAATIATGGVVSPGNNSIATLNFGSTLTLNSGSEYAVGITGNGVNDKVNVTGALAANGTIKVSLVSYTPVANDTFDLADAASITGTPSFDLPTLSAGLSWDTSTFTTNGQIKVISADPFLTWASGYGLSGGDAAKTADPDGDGVINLLEFATNSNPTSGGSGSRVYGKIHMIGGTPVLTYTVATRADATFAANGSKQETTKDLIKYTIEGSDDLSTWNTVVVTEVVGADATAVRAAIVPALPTLDTGWEWHTFRTDGDTSSDASDYIRLKVAEAP